MKKDLISRSALTERIVDLLVFHWGYEGVEEDVKQIFNEIPAVDAAEVIRCKDCFYWMKAKTNRNGFLVCPKSGMEIVATDYCSRSERRKCNYDR